MLVTGGARQLAAAAHSALLSGLLLFFTSQAFKLLCCRKIQSLPPCLLLDTAAQAQPMHKKQMSLACQLCPRERRRTAFDCS